MPVGMSGGHVLGAALVRLPMRHPSGQASPAVGGIYRTGPGFKAVLEEPPGHRQCAPKKWQHRVSKFGDDRTGLRRVHDPDRPELLFSRREHLHSAPLEERGVQKNGRSHGLNPCPAPLTPASTATATKKKKNCLFPFQPREQKFKPGVESRNVGGKRLLNFRLHLS